MSGRQLAGKAGGAASKEEKRRNAETKQTNAWDRPLRSEHQSEQSISAIHTRASFLETQTTQTTSLQSLYIRKDFALCRAGGASHGTPTSPHTSPPPAAGSKDARDVSMIGIERTQITRRLAALCVMGALTAGAAAAQAEDDVRRRQNESALVPDRSALTSEELQSMPLWPRVEIDALLAGEDVVAAAAPSAAEPPPAVDVHFVIQVGRPHRARAEKKIDSRRFRDGHLPII